MLYLAVLFEVIGKTQEENLTLLFEENTATAEEYVSLHLIAVAEEFLGVLEFEVVVVLIGLRSETNFLHLHLYLLCFQFLLPLLLLIEELGIVNHATNRWLGIG